MHLLVETEFDGEDAEEVGLGVQDVHLEVDVVLRHSHKVSYLNVVGGKDSIQRRRSHQRSTTHSQQMLGLHNGLNVTHVFQRG